MGLYQRIKTVKPGIGTME
jgi:hypothetical protein